MANAPKLDFPRQNDEGDTIMQDEMQDEAWVNQLRDSSLNARKQSPYGPQFPALAQYFKAK